MNVIKNSATTISFFCSGIGHGHQFLTPAMNRYTVETLGKNYYLGMVGALEQVFFLQNIFSSIGKEERNQLPIFRSFKFRYVYLIIILSTLSKQGSYEEICTKIHDCIKSIFGYIQNGFSSIRYLAFVGYLLTLISKPLPPLTQLVGRTMPLQIKALHGVVNYSNTLLVVASLTSILYLGTLGKKAFALGACLYSLYELLNHFNYIPETISTQVNNITPVCSCLDSFFRADSTFLRIINFYKLILISPKISASFLSLIEYLGFWAFSLLKGFEKREWSNMHTPPTPLSFDDACVFLATTKEKAQKFFKFNYHLLAVTCLERKVEEAPKNNNFAEFLDLFAKVNWELEKSYKIILSKVLGDERFFHEFIQEILVEKKGGDKKTTFETFQSERRTEEDKNKLINQILDRKKLGVTKEQFLADWVKKQMDLFVKKLIGTAIARERNITYLIGARPKFAVVLHHIQTLMKETNGLEIHSVYIQDTLLRCAVDGGGYCDIAYFNLSSDLTREIFGQAILSYKDSLLQEFEQQRTVKVEQMASEAIEKGPITKTLSTNRHMGNEFLNQFIGIYPTTTQKQEELGFFHFLWWKLTTLRTSTEFYDIESYDFDIKCTEDSLKLVYEALGISNNSMRQINLLMQIAKNSKIVPSQIKMMKMDLKEAKKMLQHQDQFSKELYYPEKRLELIGQIVKSQKALDAEKEPLGSKHSHFTLLVLACAGILRKS